MIIRVDYYYSKGTDDKLINEDTVIFQIPEDRIDDEMYITDILKHKVGKSKVKIKSYEEI